MRAVSGVPSAGYGAREGHLRCPGTVEGVNTKTRIRIVSGALVLLFVVVAVAAAFGG